VSDSTSSAAGSTAAGSTAAGSWAVATPAGSPPWGAVPSVDCSWEPSPACGSVAPPSDTAPVSTRALVAGSLAGSTLATGSSTASAEAASDSTRPRSVRSWATVSSVSSVCSISASTEPTLPSSSRSTSSRKLPRRRAASSRSAALSAETQLAARTLPSSTPPNTQRVERPAPDGANRTPRGGSDWAFRGHMTELSCHARGALPPHPGRSLPEAAPSAASPAALNGRRRTLWPAASSFCPVGRSRTRGAASPWRSGR
jgi:hypothetical protein